MVFTHVPLSKPLVELKAKTTSKGRNYTTPEGNVYPSITTILGFKEKPWLENWRNALGPDKAAKETQRCADRGTAVHELAEKYLNNEEGFLKGIAPEYIRGFNQLKFQLNKIDNIRIQEAPLFSDDMRIAGRVDCVGEYEKELSIIDFKTSNNDKDVDMVFDYFLQCTAYAIMWMQRTGEPIDNITVLMSVERGLVPLVFKDSVDKYVEPLLKRIHEYHRMH